MAEDPRVHHGKVTDLTGSAPSGCDPGGVDVLIGLPDPAKPSTRAASAEMTSQNETRSFDQRNLRPALTTRFRETQLGWLLTLKASVNGNSKTASFCSLITSKWLADQTAVPFA
jgi:hypothetical protein